MSKKSREYQIGGDHYKEMKIQPWDVLEEHMSQEKYVGYHVGTAIAYLIRHERKGGMNDIKKAHHHLTALIEYLENNKEFDAYINRSSLYKSISPNIVERDIEEKSCNSCRFNDFDLHDGSECRNCHIYNKWEVVKDCTTCKYEQSNPDILPCIFCDDESRWEQKEYDDVDSDLFDCDTCRFACSEAACDSPVPCGENRSQWKPKNDCTTCYFYESGDNVVNCKNPLKCVDLNNWLPKHPRKTMRVGE